MTAWTLDGLILGLAIFATTTVVAIVLIAIINTARQALARWRAHRAGRRWRRLLEDSAAVRAASKRYAKDAERIRAWQEADAAIAKERKL